MATQSGFSLIEVLVSLALLSLAALSGLILLESLTRTHTRLDERYVRLEQLQIFLADFSQDISSAETVSLQSGGASLALQTRTCNGLIEYTMRAGTLVRDAPGCPEYRFELGGIAEARFSVIAESMQASAAFPSPDDPEPEPRAVRLDLVFAQGRSGMILYRIVDLPGKPAP